MLAAIVLAAGASTRMGSPKALLPDPDGRPFVARIVRSLAASGLDTIAVVTGSQHAAIVEALSADHPPIVPKVVQNPDPSRGQLSSLWVGMDAVITPAAQGLLMTLVDVPMVSVSTIQLVIDAWRRSRAPVVRPAVGAQHGHPVIFDRAVFDDLRAASLDTGAKAVIRSNAALVLDVPVHDRGCLIDVDTPADYARLRNFPT